MLGWGEILVGAPSLAGTASGFFFFLARTASGKCALVAAAAAASAIQPHVTAHQWCVCQSPSSVPAGPRGAWASRGWR